MVVCFHCQGQQEQYTTKKTRTPGECYRGPFPVEQRGPPPQQARTPIVYHIQRVPDPWKRGTGTLCYPPLRYPQKSIAQTGYPWQCFKGKYVQSVDKHQAIMYTLDRGV